MKDNQRLVGAKTRFGSPIQTYDNGFGPLWIHRNSIGITAVVRAQTWSDAYEICEDEFFDEVGETWQELEREFSTEYLSGRELWLWEYILLHPGATQLSAWEMWCALSDSQKDVAYFKAGRHVPWLGDITDHPCFQEQYGFRPNAGDKGILYAKDLNGDYLDRLTPELQAELEITVEVEGE